MKIEALTDDKMKAAAGVFITTLVEMTGVDTDETQICLGLKDGSEITVSLGDTLDWITRSTTETSTLTAENERLRDALEVVADCIGSQAGLLEKMPAMATGVVAALKVIELDARAALNPTGDA